ncbi:MAG TPA: caspase family protein [Chloroflexota bacterium]|nr:caspase family protein [Chloroflexota bacterium]
MADPRSALIVASDTYHDPQLARLRAPGRDAEALAAVLRDPAIGGFDVSVSLNQHHYEVRVALEDFFADRGPDDVLLLHFSCHGIKDEAGRLFFAAADTEKNRLNATGIAADYVNDLLGHARSRRVLLLLDCCFSGAFTRGMLARSGPTLDVAERFQGRGRAVLTASGALEYAWEGDDLTRLGEPSVFTSAVVRGLRTGEADRDGDQQVSVDELYDYVYDEVRRATPHQTPGKWSNVQGTLIIARSPRPGVPATALPAELREAVADERAWVRAAAVEQLAELLRGPDAGQVRAASGALRRLVQDDSRRVSAAAERVLGGDAPSAVVHDRERGSVSEGAVVPTAPWPAWLAPATVGGGWALAWLVSLALAASVWVEDVRGGVVLALAGWVITAPLVAAALWWVAPGPSTRRALLVGLGWPVCMLMGLGVPLVLRLGSEGAGLLAVGVAAAGLLGAVSVTPHDRPIPLDRVLAATAGWCAGWLWPGTTAWPLAFWRLANEYDATLASMMETVSLLQLAAGGALSGLLGGALMWALLRRRGIPARR